MSFSGTPTTFVDRAIPNDGFWPNLGVAEFQAGYRLPAEYLVDLLADSLTIAMGEVNRDLAKRKAAWQAAGMVSVETADPLLLPERAFYAAIYKRAVYCRAKAFLLKQFATINRRPEAANLAKESPETYEQFLALSQEAVRQIQGRGRITAVLL
ncbi:TPA: head completion/stabilization protein [Pseudomonas aeruginosa]|nr:head completion/stabilization protein [Pseudomonas aeruginosa]